MSLRERYEEIVRRMGEAHSQFLSDRLTLTRKEAQLREAVVEEADDQADYFEGRTHAMEAVVQADEARYRVLATEAETVRAQLVTEEIQAMLNQFDAMIVDLTERARAMAHQLEEATPLIRGAEARAASLPASTTTAPRAAVEAASARFADVDQLLDQLLTALTRDTHGTEPREG